MEKNAYIEYIEMMSRSLLVIAKHLSSVQPKYIWD